MKKYIKESRKKSKRDCLNTTIVQSNKSVEVVFYDPTTIHLERQLSDDELRDFGFILFGCSIPCHLLAKRSKTSVSSSTRCQGFQSAKSISKSGIYNEV